MSKKLEFQVTVDPKLIDAMVGSIKGRLGDLKSDIQICAVSCVMRAFNNGDYTRATNLFWTLKESDAVKAQALATWFRTYLPVKWQKYKEKDVVGKRTHQFASIKDTDSEELKAKRDQIVGEYQKGEAEYQAKCESDLIWKPAEKKDKAAFDLKKALQKALRKADVKDTKLVALVVGVVQKMQKEPNFLRFEIDGFVIERKQVAKPEPANDQAATEVQQAA